MLKALWNDDCGAILSMELVLIATILVIGMVVGLSELAHSVANELNDVGEAIGSLNQSYSFGGFQVLAANGLHCPSSKPGSSFTDRTDMCDGNECAISCATAAPETPK